MRKIYDFILKEFYFSNKLKYWKMIREPAVQMRRIGGVGGGFGQPPQNNEENDEEEFRYRLRFIRPRVNNGGGGLFGARQNVRKFFLTKFLINGGAIYLEKCNNNLLINNIFLENNANKGGAIYLNLQGYLFFLRF